MAQVIIECAAPSLNPLVRAIESLTRTANIEISVLHAGDVGRMYYRETDQSLAEMMPSLNAGLIGSLMITPKSSPIRSFLLYRPNLFAESLSLWHLVVDYLSWDFMEGITAIGQIDGLRFVSAALENSLGLTDSDLDNDKFPWQSQELILVLSSPDCRVESWRARRGSCYGLPQQVLSALDKFMATHK